MTLPLVVLAVSLVFRFYAVNPFDGASSWIARAVSRPESVVPLALAAPSAEVVREGPRQREPDGDADLAVASPRLGILAAFATYYWKRISADAVARSLAPVYTFFLNKWYFDELYKAVVVNGCFSALAAVLRWVDTYIVDGAVNGAGTVARGVSFVSGKFDTYVVDGLVNFSALHLGLLRARPEEVPDREGADLRAVRGPRGHGVLVWTETCR